MNDELLSFRDGIRHPRKYFTQVFRQPRKHFRELFKYPRRALFGKPRSVDFRAEIANDIAKKNIGALAEIRGDLATKAAIEEKTGILTRKLWPWKEAQSVPATMPNGSPWPRISIVTPSLNQGAYIEQTIRSVLLQRYPNLQYIVVDGGSTDCTRTILNRYANEIDVCISEHDDGQAAAINKGFQHADGEILAWLNSDDMQMPDALVSVAMAFEQAKAANADIQPDLVCGQAFLLDEQTDAITSTHKNRFEKGMHILPKNISDFDNVWQKQPGFFFQPEVFFTRRIWTKIGSSLNSSLHYALDYDLWIRMSKHNVALVSLDKPLAIFRVHPSQKTKFGAAVLYPEHLAVSAFHRANPVPDARYVPDRFLATNIHETIPPDIYRNMPLSYHQTLLGNYFVPCLAENDVIARCMRSGRIFEPQVAEAAKALIKPGTLVLDVGANFGQMSLLFSDFTGKEGMVFSFEAQEYCFAVLLKNIAANQKENIRAFHTAVFDHTRDEVTVPDVVFEKYPSYGSFAIGLENSPTVEKRIKTMAIDDLRIERPISFLKIDAQGSDLSIMKGARETILRHRMPVMFEYEEEFREAFGFKFEDYIDFVHSIGYRFDRVVDKINYIIVPDDKLQAKPAEPAYQSPRPDLIAIPTPPFRKQLNKFLKNRSEVSECTEFLHRHGYVSHNLKCKDWDLALIIPEIGDGNVLDMGSSDSYILKNVCLKRTKGEKYGIDYNDPDVPLSEVHYMKGSLMQTPLPDGHLQYITCLSVIEHQVDFHLFAKEVNRLLSSGGKLFVTYDFWEPLLKIPVKAYGLDWQPLDRALVESLIVECKKQNLHLNQEVDWSTGDAVIRWGYYSPHPEVAYTFGLLVFEKR